jgi:hypothetical protein
MKTYDILVGKSGRMRQLKRSMCKWEDSRLIEVDVNKTECKSVDWDQRAQHMVHRRVFMKISL